MHFSCDGLHGSCARGRSQDERRPQESAAQKDRFMLYHELRLFQPALRGNCLMPRASSVVVVRYNSKVYGIYLCCIDLSRWHLNITNFTIRYSDTTNDVWCVISVRDTLGVLGFRLSCFKENDSLD